ncbi:MAG TPA: SDR family oxidoreductase [Candidatus Elarobacter sp.]|jgi:NAD(P)-dependent dehydrogenase (short-subunit alcohol dehydrogenase family)
MPSPNGGDRVAIVAGASGGIGTATVRELLSRGMRVVASALDDALLAALRAEVAHVGERVSVVATDITRRDDVDALVARTLVGFGRVDAMVNAAGIGSSPSLCDSSDAEIERVLAVNLLGAARLIHAVLPIMKAQRGGAIVTVGSVAGEAGVMGIYSASKFGLRGLSDSVRREVRSYGIGVTLIEPGFVRTPMNAAMSGLPGPEVVATAIAAAIDRPRRAHIVPARYRIPVFIVKTFPGFTDLVFGDARIQRRLNRDARAARDGAVTERTEST